MRVAILAILLALEIALFTVLGGQTFSSAADFLAYFRSYFADLLIQSTPILLLAFGMTLILMTGGIDLSAASTVAVISCLMGLFAPGASFWWLAVPTAAMAACLLGLGNGLLIGRLGVPPIIATLGTMIFYRGLCFVLLGDLEKAPFLEVPGYELAGGVAGSLVALGLLYGLGGAWFNNSVWRRELLLIGGNRIAARYAAIPVGRRLAEVYTLAGALAFLAAVSFTARNSSVSASSLAGMELRVIVAVILGGTRVQGGSGSLLGSFFGVLFIAVMDEGLRGAAIWGEKHLPFKLSHLQFILLGTLLVAGVWLNNWLDARDASKRE